MSRLLEQAAEKLRWRELVVCDAASSDTTREDTTLYARLLHLSAFRLWLAYVTAASNIIHFYVLTISQPVGHHHQTLVNSFSIAINPT